MFDISLETFLYEYFVFDAMLGKHNDREKLFYELGDLYGLDREEIAPFFDRINEEAVSGIRTESDYYRYSRIAQYHNMTGAPCVMTGQDDLIAIKGNAIVQIKEEELLAASDATASLLFKDIIRRAAGGTIVALRVLGVLQCTGIYMEKDVKHGLKNLRHAAEWGDVVSAIALLKYQPEELAKNGAIFLACIKDTPCEFLREPLSARYGITGRADRDVLLLRKGIAAGKAKSGMRDSTFARIAFSAVIGHEDKEALIFSESRETASEACELPLSLAYRELSPDRKAFSAHAFASEQEKSEAIGNLENVDLRAGAAYTPLCLSSDSAVMRESFFDAIKATFPDANVEKIEVANLTERDFEPTKNNIFLRSLIEKKSNVLVFFFDGGVSEEVYERVAAFLNGEKRSRFRLNYPAVTMDLGSVRPICICDRDHVRRLGKFAEVVSVKGLDSADKAAAIKILCDQRCRLYGIACGGVEDEVVTALSAMTIDNAAKVIDKMLKESRGKLDLIGITMEIAAPYLKGKGSGDFGYGFGGTIL